MILSDYASLTSAERCSLKEASYDSQNKEWMTESELQVINFDKLKEQFSRKKHLMVFPDSADAVFDDGKDKLFLVEFKNGYLDKKSQKEIQKKVYDSVLILLDEMDLKLPDFRTDAVFILVYNEPKNKDNNDPEFVKKRQNARFVQESKSLHAFASSISRHGKNEYVCFGMKIFRKYLFQSVHTFNQEEFERFLMIYIKIQQKSREG